MVGSGHEAYQTYTTLVLLSATSNNASKTVPLFFPVLDRVVFVRRAEKSDPALLNDRIPESIDTVCCIRVIVATRLGFFLRRRAIGTNVCSDSLGETCR